MRASGASGSGDGARDRHDHYRVRAGAFQGAGARLRRGAGGVHVIEQKDRRRNRAASRHVECPLDVFMPQDPGKERLGNPLPGSGKGQRIERETDESRKTGSDQSGQVEPPPEIFPGVGRYRDHGRRNTVRDQVPPSPDKDLAEAPGYCVDRVGEGGVFRGNDRGASVPRVGEQGARDVERWRGGGAEAAWGRARYGSGTGEGAAPGAHGSGVGGPPGDGGRRKIGGCRRKEVPERGQSGDPCRRSRRRRGGAPLPDEMRSLGYPATYDSRGKAEVIALGLWGDARRVSGRWRRRRTPGCRGRWRTRSMSRRRRTGRPT